MLGSAERGRRRACVWISGSAAEERRMSSLDASEKVTRRIASCDLLKPLRERCVLFCFCQTSTALVKRTRIALKFGLKTFSLKKFYKKDIGRKRFLFSFVRQKWPAHFWALFHLPAHFWPASSHFLLLSRRKRILVHHFDFQKYSDAFWRASLSNWFAEPPSLSPGKRPPRLFIAPGVSRVSQLSGSLFLANSHEFCDEAIFEIFQKSEYLNFDILKPFLLKLKIGWTLKSSQDLTRHERRRARQIWLHTLTSEHLARPQLRRQ